MKAFVMKQTEQVGFVDEPIPKPGPKDAIMATTGALICTFDEMERAFEGSDKKLNGVAKPPIIC